MPDPLDYFIPSLLPGLQQRAQGFPASYSQERFWFVHQLAPDSAAYNLPACFRLRGQLDLPVLERSLNEVVQRHQVLRSSFIYADNQLRQLVTSPLDFKLRVLDLRRTPPAERELELERMLAAEASQPFALSEPPLLRGTVVRMADTDQVLIIVLHHIVADGWSLGILSWELTTLYGAFLTQAPSPLPPLSLQFGEYSRWERQEVESARMREQLAFWQENLRGQPPALQIKPDRAHPTHPTFHGAIHPMELSPELTATMKAVCRRERITPFMLLLAVFQLLLHGWNGLDDIIVGTPAINRNREELEGLIGLFVNLLVLRTDAGGNPTCRQFLARVRGVVLAATDHQEVPFEKVLEVLRLKRGLDQNPLAQVLFTFQRGPIHLNLPGLESQSIFLNTGAAKFDIFMEWWEAGQGLHGRLEYNTDLFSEETIARMAEHYRLIMELVLACPESNLSHIITRIPNIPAKAVPDPAPTREPGPLSFVGNSESGDLPVTDTRRSIEEMLTQIWRQVLRMDPVGRNDNFFELGGHSLLIMQVIARVQAAFKITLPIDAPFEAPTIAELAAVIEARVIEEIGSLTEEEASQLL